RADAVAVGANGTVDVVGSLGTANAIFDGTTLARNGSTDAFVWRTQPANPEVPLVNPWAFNLGNSSQNVNIVTTATTASRNTVVAGVFTGTIDFDPGPSTHTLTASSGSGFVAEYSAAGKFVWVDQVKGTVTDVTVDASGNVYAAGSFTGNASFGGTTKTAA